MTLIALPRRLLLWIDGVGGYLVCLADQVVLGPSHPVGEADVPLLADLSRKHATIERQGEHYLLRSERTVSIDGAPVDRTPLATGQTAGAALLRAGQIIGLGSSVQLRFAQSHPLSCTATLEFISRHRTQPPVDGVVLLAESLWLGPEPHAHIRCPNWPGSVLLFRTAAGLAVRAGGEFAVDGQPRHGESPVQPRSQVKASWFSLALETA